MEQVQVAAKRPEVSDERSARKESARAATAALQSKLSELHIFVDPLGPHPHETRLAIRLSFVHQADAVSKGIAGDKQLMCSFLDVTI